MAARAAARRRCRRRITRSPASKPRSEATSTTGSESRRAGAATEYRFVGGKGGVGKTTCAAAIAVRAAASGRRTLVISTDPAPSLGDALARPLTASPRSLATRRGSLHAVEIDAARALDRWLSTRRSALERIALRGTWLDRDDVSRLLRLSMPGIDELAALFEIARFGRTGRFDLIVVDTAPTGHTLRMLSMPDTLRGIARVFDHMQAKHRVMVEALRGGWEPDPEDALIDELDRDGRELAALLRDPASVRTSWVTLPEPMAIEETADAAEALARQGIPLHDVIVNRVTPRPPRPCARCDARRAFERKAMRALEKRIPGMPATAIAARDAEPTGLRALASIGAELDAAAEMPVRAAGRRVARWRAPVAGGAGADALAALKGRDTRLLMFGGKGGVGKTTCAAAAALALAAAEPRRRILLLSTDPAHSLGDVFGVRISDTATSVPTAPPNLTVRELDAAAGFRHVRERYASAIDGLFDRLGRGASDIGIDARHDRNVMHGLIDLAPPGIDELAAIIDVTDALDAGEEGGYDLVVMDTAPSGHALRLLEMPALVHDWAKALMAILLKYQPIVGVGDLGAVVVKLSQGLGRLRALLANAERTSFVAVTRGAALPRAETGRLLARLRRMKVHVPAVIVNAVGFGTCARCRRASAVEGREIRRLSRSLPRGRARPVLVIAAAEVPPPHGATQLRRWQGSWGFTVGGSRSSALRTPRSSEARRSGEDGG